MNFFPLIRGHVNLSTTKWILFRYLKDNCEEDYPLVSNRPIFSEIKHAYGLELYEDSFMVWEIPGTGWLFTTLHGSVIETSNGIRLDYHIRFNLYTNFLFLLMVGTTAYFFYKSILENESMDFNLSLIGIGTILISLWSFNSDARSNLEFISRLERKFSNSNNKE